MNIYIKYVDTMYNNYLKKRFGINTCCNSKISMQELNNDYCIAEYLRSGSNCSRKIYYSTNSSDKMNNGLYIAVEVGTPQALAEGISEGNTEFIHPLLKDKNVQVFRNNILLTPFNRGDGSLYYIKEKYSDKIEYSQPLESGEIIQINTV